MQVVSPWAIFNRLAYNLLELFCFHVYAKKKGIISYNPLGAAKVVMSLESERNSILMEGHV